MKNKYIIPVLLFLGGLGAGALLHSWIGRENTARSLTPTARPSPSPVSAIKPVKIASVPVPRPVPPAPAPAPASAGQTGIVARIGNQAVITDQDLSDFTSTESCYGPDAINSRKAGFMRMLEATVAEQVLAREARILLSAEDYAKERQRVDEGTRAPDILACIKKYFGWDPSTGWPADNSGRGRYERVFLRKNIISAPFGKFVNYDPKIQKEVFDKRDAIRAPARQGAAFEDMGKEYQVDYSSRTYSLTEPKAESKDAASAAGQPPGMRWSPFEAQFIEENLKNLSPGQMKPEPLESGGDIQFIKLVGKDGDQYKFETLVIKRKSVDQYFATLPKFQTHIYDAELKAWMMGMPNHSLHAILKID